jgi:hypothetical protein
MDQKKINEVIDSMGNEPTDKLVAMFKNRGPGQPEEFFESIRRILAVRGVSDPTAYVPVPSQDTNATGLGGAGFAIIGGIIGGFVGILIGKTPLLSFGHVLTRGITLTGLDVLLRPAAESAFNWMVAGIVVGAAAGFALVYLKSPQNALLQSASTSTAQLATPPSPSNCVHCGAGVPVGMQFCGKCGKSVSGLVCQTCGKTSPSDQSFCGGCGARLS